MKYLYTFSLLFLLASCGKEEKKTIDRTTSDWAHYQLKGDVMSVTEKSYELNENLEKGRPGNENRSAHDFELQFNDEGKLVKEIKWSKDMVFEETTFNGKDQKLVQISYMKGQPSMKREYTWDKSGKYNLSVTKRNPDNSQLNRVEMTYKNDKMIEKVTYGTQEHPTDRITYVYDAKGNLTEENLFMKSEVVQYKKLYAYDRDNRKVSESTYDKDGKLMYKTLYGYDGDNLVSVETINENGEPGDVEKYSYDDKGNLTMEYEFSSFNNSESTEEIIYDDKGNKIKRIITRDKKPVAVVSYAYDEHDNLIKTEVQDNQNNFTESRSYRYEYDKKGNWIKRLSFINDEPKYVIERQIKYFDEL